MMIIRNVKHTRDRPYKHGDPRFVDKDIIFIFLIQLDSAEVMFEYLNLRDHTSNLYV